MESYFVCYLSIFSCLKDDFFFHFLNIFLHIIDQNRQNTSRKTKSGFAFLGLDLKSLIVLLTQEGDVKSGKGDITTLQL